MTCRSNRVDALPCVVAVVAAAIVAQLAKATKEVSFDVALTLHAPNLVRDRHELTGKSLNFQIRPDRPPGHAIVSRTGHGMPVHRPQQNRLVL